MLGLALVLRVFVPAVEEVQLKVFDSFRRISPRVYEPAPVRIIDLDNASLEKIGQWPWPRTVLADLTARLGNMGAAVIVFDMVFAESDRTSPGNVLPMWPATPEIEALRDRSDALPDHDAIFADVLAQVNAVTGFVLSTGRAAESAR